ncbi:mechanosensitive ion channel [uncultured Aquimarina sp.]|uniref:mechanosensitive ion channel n=1 Tax=uncultured Aquimarina sp. TaxID=575652 RepID=UPI00260B14B4|nr:mechanosensitive ion channel [uncultured Aquimarina sp.]
MDYLNNLLQNFTNGSFFPNIVLAIVILILGWLIATVIKKVAIKLIRKTGIDDKLKSDKVKLSDFIGKLLYFLIMIFVLMLVLDKLGIQNVMDPIKTMLSGFLGFIPNIIGAGLVGYIGYMLASIVSELIGLSGNTIQKFTPKLKLPENIDLVTILKKIVFIFIFFPLLIAALNILNMESISQPATAMLETFLGAIPKVLVAAIILIIFIVGGRFVSELLKDLLNSMNLNNFFNKINLNSITGSTNVVKLIGNIVYFFIVIFGIVTAVEKLEFGRLTEILSTIINYSGNILFGLVILAIGNWIATIAYQNFAKKEENKFVGSIIRMAVIAIFLAIGLGTMGIANEIINLAFGLTLGTIAVTIALSFGLGGREAAGKQMEKILNKFNKKS